MRIKKSHRQRGPSSNFDEHGDPLPPAWQPIYEAEDSDGYWQEISEAEALRLIASGLARLM